MRTACWSKTAPPFYVSHGNYAYLKSAGHDDEQNGGQSFHLQAKIPKLWRH